ncbi:MAG TPA: thiol-disulfide oxidoreductase DCC family protein [Allosphingosinicella sp.]|nr:thiol-disulfide oxidoreductase DCC family protein [Allosphingosinicella sp.]
MTQAGRPIVVFDALCPLCSANAQFILKHDKRRRFRLASMQSEAGAALYRRFGIDPADPETMILVEGGRALRDSDAVLAICRGLGWPWRLASLARAVPRSVRDPLYRRVARNRYRLFGRRPTCWLPDAGSADRFL